VELAGTNSATRICADPVFELERVPVGSSALETVPSLATRPGTRRRRHQRWPIRLGKTIDACCAKYARSLARSPWSTACADTL
jgi:hypothetical protein